MQQSSIARSLVLVLLTATAGHAQEKRPMTVVDLLNVPALSDPRLSPDGRQLLYVLAESDWEANRQVAHIWRVNTDGTGLIQLTNASDGEQSPRWSPDGSRVAFLASRGDAEEQQIYVMSNSGGEALRLTEHETAISSIACSPDGEWIYFLAPDPKTEAEKERDDVKDDVFAFDEDFKQRHLWRVSWSDRTSERLTEGDYSILRYRVSRDGGAITFHRGPSPLLDDSDEGEAWVMAADAGNPRKLTSNTVAERGAALSPDGTQVLFVADASESFDTYYNDNLFLVPAAGGSHRMLLADMPHEVQSAAWSRDGEAIYFLANTGVRSELFQVDVVTEKLTQLTEGDHAISGWSYDHWTDAHVYSVNERTNAGDVWMLPASGGRRSRITRVFDYLDLDFKLPRQEAIQWKGEDGETVGGLLYYPLDYQEGTRYGLVVQTHGGPAASDKFGFGSWSRFVQVATSMGYAVLKPNYRGSTGYGDDFLRDMVGHYYRNAHLDVMTGVDHVIEMGVADGDRMVKMGWSGGGHMTNKIITHTDRFKAAASGAGAVNWISMYGQSDVRIYRTPWFGGTPWQEDAPIDRYWDHSPLKDIYKAKTPTLVLVGENDVRVPPPQSVELYRALKSNGVDTHLYMAPREPHGWRELRHRLFLVNVQLEWFERHAMNREYTWAKAPDGHGQVSKDTKPTPE